MSDFKFPHLFEPIQIAGQLFKNRIFASPQGYANTAPDRFINDSIVAFYETKARGGFASVCVGDCLVDWETGRWHNFLSPINDPLMQPGYSSVARAISRHGAVAAAELSHTGMYSRAVMEDGKPLYGPVEMENKYGHVQEMPESVILSIIDSYASAAAFLKQYGFEMITIHGGHGWLLQQFMSPELNTRGDKWGGSFENRMRFSLAVIESVRRVVGKRFPIEFRMSGAELCPGGYDIDEGIRIAKALDGVVDLIHVSTGNHEYDASTIHTHPSMFLPDGVNLKYAAAIKAQVKTPVVTVGAYTDPAHMEEVLASGEADIVALGRQSLADPELPRKAMTGREDEIRRCLRCSSCFECAGRQRLFGCAVNPVIGNEIEAHFELPPAEKKRVLVVGGGVAGMQAALTAAERGHSVILCEKRPRLGGALLCEENIPFKQRLKAYLEVQAHMLAKASVDVRLNAEVTPEYAAGIGADVLIAALGARPVRPDIAGIGLENVMGAEAAYYEPGAVGKRAVILGGGLVGVELAIHLASEGRDVTIVEALPELSVSPFGMHTMALRDRLEKLQITVLCSASAEEITASGVAVARGGERLYLPADTVIYAVGQSPLRAEALALRGGAPEFYQIGDCVTPKNILAATQLAWAIGRDIGRK